MAQKTGLTQQLRQQTRITQQQIRFVRMLEMNGPELEEAVSRELDENPALEAEEDTAPVADESPRYRDLNAYRRPDSDYHALEPAMPDNLPSLYEHLQRQAEQLDLDPLMRQATEQIIGSLDDNGYLRRPLQALADDLLIQQGIDVSPEVMQQALLTVRALDPAGVAATDLQESLRLQLEARRPSEVRDDALRVVSQRFDDLAHRRHQKIKSALRLTDQRLTAALDYIKGLNPKPGAQYAGVQEAAQTVIPDFEIETDRSGEITATVPNRIPHLAVSASFSAAIGAARATRRRANQYLNTRLNDARDFIALIAQRQQTLLSVITAIASLQRDYLTTQDPGRLKPMSLKDIAAITGLDLSVISRATAGKYVQLPWGIKPLRYFFSESFQQTTTDEAEAISGRRIETEIRTLVDGEDHAKPLSDDAICEALRAKGFDISRRTVAKYRDRMGIEPSRLRRR